MVDLYQNFEYTMTFTQQPFVSQDEIASSSGAGVTKRQKIN